MKKQKIVLTEMSKKVKTVIDTSVYIAALISRSETSAPVRLIRNLRRGNFLAILSPQIIDEILNTTIVKLKIEENKVVEFLRSLKGNIVKIKGSYLYYGLDKTDPKDNMILGAAIEGSADYIVSLDKKHILPLKNCHGTQIVNINDFLRQFEQYESILNRVAEEAIL